MQLLTLKAALSVVLVVSLFGVMWQSMKSHDTPPRVPCHTFLAPEQVALLRRQYHAFLRLPPGTRRCSAIWAYNRAYCHAYHIPYHISNATHFPMDLSECPAGTIPNGAPATPRSAYKRYKSYGCRPCYGYRP